MKEEEQRIAIAEACGWKWYRQAASGPWAKKPMRSLYHPELMRLREKPLDLADMTERECNPAYLWREGIISDYLHDLNAMHEAETVLTDAQWLAYLHGIYRLCPSYREGSYWYENFQSQREVVSATAAQRAEAFLRTIGKWRESAPPNPLASH